MVAEGLIDLIIVFSLKSAEEDLSVLFKRAATCQIFLELSLWHEDDPFGSGLMKNSVDGNISFDV